ncbi:MAG: aminotransferase class III-fold pyridoxal phosphate-dependent enzyme [Candidatus Vogelbacteria bacterium]|nr:aminotransferase class III-fold pyridoxal phosphate-dependent enzyme [Candidatus Vogelbacteria bacterium]
MKKIKKIEKLNISTGLSMWKRAKKIIPGGSQLLSKRSEMFLPDRWPSYYQKAGGVSVTDLDGNKFIDMSIMGIGSCTLGYADIDVNREVKKAIDNGSMSTLNSLEEVELAELLCKIHPWAKMVRYARTGGESMAIAVRIARAYSKKDGVVFCGYHGWSDWYLAANLSDNKSLDGHLLPGLDPAGVPSSLAGSTLTFSYNKIEELEKITSENKNIGVIVVEPLRHQEPENDFLKKVRAIADKIGAVLIFDEITIAWRLNVGGVHLLYGVNPDIAVFGKAMSNGYPMAAIIGRENVMQAAQKTFISSTYWTERIGPTAALATIKKMQKVKLPKHLKMIGSQIGRGWESLARKHGLKLKVIGPEALVTFILDYGEESQSIRTLFTQEMLKRGYLASPSVYVSYAHSRSIVDKYLKEVDVVFSILSDAIQSGTIGKLLEGPVAHTGFKRLT